MNEIIESKETEMIDLLISKTDTNNKKQKLILFCLAGALKYKLSENDILDLSDNNSIKREDLDRYLNLLKDLNNDELFNLQKQLLGEILS